MGFHKLLESLPVTTTLTEVAGFATLVFFLFYCILHKSRRNGGRLLPGPYPCPIIGNLHQLKQPAHRSLKDLAYQYGPIMLLRLGSVPTVVVSSSEMAKHFLKTHDSIFSSRPTTAAGKYLSYNFKGLIFSPYGDHWRQMRKLCVLELLTAKRMKSFKHVREEEVYATIRSIWEASKNGTASVNVSKAISTLSSNIIWRMLARKKFSDNDLGADGKGFKALILELSATTGALNIGDFIPYLDWMDLQGIKRRMKKTNKTYDAFADKIIEDHLHVHDHTAIDGQAEDVKDFVDVLLQMTAENDHLKGDTKATRDTIKAIMLDIFAAGTETTASTLEWVMSELLRHPDAMKRLQEEIESIVGKHLNVNESDVANMKYLQCVVKETLRLYPPAPLAIPHESTKAVTVSGYDIPNKTTVIVNVWAIGRDPNVWGADASEFKPERFLDVFDGPENSMDLTGQSDFRILPFSAGRRGCPGAAMAILVIEFALAQLLHSFDWSVEGDPSKLDMTEACGSSTPRQVALYAFPTLRWGIF